MKTIVVQSLPLKEVISDLADAMGTQYFENCQQFHLEIPPIFGNGTIKGINFETGMGILQYDCTFLDEIEIQFTVNNVHPLKFLFCSEGSFAHHFENDDSVHKIDVYKNAIVASSHQHGHILRFQSNKRTRINSLEISRQTFVDNMDCELMTMNDTLQELFIDLEAKMMFYYEGFYSFKIAELLEEMEQFSHQDFLKKIFLQGKCYEILTQQILQYQDDLNDDVNKGLLRKSEIILIETAANFIKENIEDFQNIEELSKSLGLNKKKIQKGFRTVYNMSVNSYVQKTRLDIASSLLSNTDLSISEISYRVGINSTSYLSKIFKDSYNLTPKEFRSKSISRKKS